MSRPNPSRPWLIGAAVALATVTSLSLTTLTVLAWPRVSPVPTEPPSPPATYVTIPGEIAVTKDQPPSPSPSPDPDLGTKPYAQAAPYELPVAGSVGFTAVATNLSPDADHAGGKLAAGQWFTILEDRGEHWLVQNGAITGTLASAQAMINLPDLIPSIVYLDSNAGSSLFQSSGVALPDITGRQLYQAKALNQKLAEEEYFMPVLYPMAAKIAAAQSAALAVGESLIIYESFRPADVQKLVGDTLVALYGANSNVKAGIDGGGWGISSFIARTLSNHQIGVAIDVSLGKVTETTRRQGRDYSFNEVVAEEYTMPTPIHELSKAAAALSAPTNTRTGDAWRNAKAGPNMNDAAFRLQAYCTDAGLRPLSSEWWHFDDWDARGQVASGANGAFRLELPVA
jgi:D-alanyl-D-alanine dipeptidase